VKFIKGEANIKEWRDSKGLYGSCCPEMDIWEANRRANAYTPHPCKTEGLLRCEGDDCGDGGGWTTGKRYDGVCDADGCDVNPFRMGNERFYGTMQDFAVDTSKPFTVVTQFITADNTDDGDLSEIRRFYVQDGKEIANPQAAVGGLTSDSITEDGCIAQKTAFSETDDFSAKGGLKQMGEAMGRGMVLVMSFWDDPASNMLWLDSEVENPDGDGTGEKRGPCATDTGKPEETRSKYSDAHVKYMNIRYGAIGSTTHTKPATPSPTSSPPPGPSPSPGGSSGFILLLLRGAHPQLTWYSPTSCGRPHFHRNPSSALP